MQCSCMFLAFHQGAMTTCFDTRFHYTHGRNPFAPGRERPSARAGGTPNYGRLGSESRHACSRHLGPPTKEGQETVRLDSQGTGRGRGRAGTSTPDSARDPGFRPGQARPWPPQSLPHSRGSASERPLRASPSALLSAALPTQCPHPTRDQFHFPHLLPPGCSCTWARGVPRRGQSTRSSVARESEVP